MKSIIGTIVAVTVSLVGIAFIYSPYTWVNVLGVLLMLISWGTLVEFLIDYLDI